MTVGGDFIPVGDAGRDFDSPSYPKLFGLTVTPTVSGALVALLGLAGAGYLLVNVVQPAWTENQTLRQDITQKESQLLNQEEVQQRIQTARQDLRQAEQLQADVLTLFATRESLNTLLLDLNERVQAQTIDPNQARGERAALLKFESPSPAPEVVADSSLGEAANNLLERQTFNVELKGNFAQTQSIMRNIERLQPLLVVQGLESKLDDASQTIVFDPRGRILPAAQPEARIATSFRLTALLPANPPAPTAVPSDATAVVNPAP